MSPIHQIFSDLKANKPFPQLPTKEAYFYAKAHKLVATDHFYAYWNSGRDKQPLIDILADHYPPLKYNHTQAKGYPGLDTYVDICKEIFNDTQTTNPSN